MSLLLQFKTEWFQNRQWWFGCPHETDSYLTKTYGSLLLDEEENAIVCVDAVVEMDMDVILGWILVYDQLPCHVQRCNKQLENLYVYRKKALMIVESVLQSKKDILTTMNGPEFGFLMLPLRHTYQWKYVYRAICITWDKVMLDLKHERMEHIEALKPFIKATFSRCPMVELEDGIDTGVYDIYKGNLESHRDSREWYFTSATERMMTILDNTPRLLNGKEDFAGEWSIEKTDVYQSVKNSIEKHQLHGKQIMISLSGGVDSMVVLWVLTKLQAQYQLKLCAVHVNYCNRNDIEEQFVVSWCTHMGVDIYVRRIREIQRERAMNLELRNIYEIYTRDCRYQLYRVAWKHQNELNASNKEIEIRSVPWITMGHNQDDCFENIVTNICHKQKYEDLKGMSDYSEASSIGFWRPMLTVPKSHIYDFAQRLHIPYLHDSTPTWSCRGKIRDVVRPVLENFHHEIITSFFHLSNTMKEMMSHMESFVELAHMRTSIINDTTKQDTYTVFRFVDLPESLLSSDLFWRMYFMKLWNRVIGIKALHHLCERLKFMKMHKIPKIHIVLMKDKDIWVTHTREGECDTNVYTFTFTDSMVS